MNNEEILRKAIERAVKNGYDAPAELTICDWEEYLELEDWCYMVIFSHDFAKTFFPKGWIVYRNGRWRDCLEKQKLSSESPFVLEKWQYHLQQMVLEKEPLKYLEKFLERKPK